MNYAVPPIVVDAVLYAVYFACTIGCIFCLIHRKIPGHIWFLPPTLLLFTLITAFVIVDIVLLFETNVKRRFDLAVAASILTYLANLVADAVLIRRCYNIWQRDWRVIVVPMILLVATTGLAFSTFATETHISFGTVWAMTFATNTLVTSLSAGRIWRHTSKTAAILGQGIQRQYIGAISIILESGVLYSLSLFLALLTQPLADYLQTDQMYTVFQCFIRVAILCSGIVPALSIIRVGLRTRTADVENTASAAFVARHGPANPDAHGDAPDLEAGRARRSLDSTTSASATGHEHTDVEEEKKQENSSTLEKIPRPRVSHSSRSTTAVGQDSIPSVLDIRHRDESMGSVLISGRGSCDGGPTATIVTVGSADSGSRFHEMLESPTELYFGPRP